MGNNKLKKGKDRLDKYYHLAKDQGYRARSAFKLIQLAKKSEFLAKSRVCIDLCGAPGSWSQVAQKNMPLGSQIICVDLAPIKPIYGVTCMIGDITTSKCRDLIRKELNGKQADCVLNDGAPNVGASWSKDAFSQSELTLAALKVSCEHLRGGGTFVTKVFRSADYNSLLWVFQQLFNKVEATKPQASRAVSAEIFVLCEGYKNPSKIDPKFFDPKFVFMETDMSAMENKKKESCLADLLKQVTKKKRAAADDEDEAPKVIDAKDFMASDQAPYVVTTHARIVFESPEGKELKKNPHTTEGILLACEDLKVLGKREMTILVKWRYKIVQEQKKAKRHAKAALFAEGGTSKAKPAANADEEEDSSSDEEEEMPKKQELTLEEELAAMLKKRTAEEKAEAKKGRVMQKKTDWRKKMALGGVFESQGEAELFNKNKQNLKLLADEDKYVTPQAEVFEDDDEDDSSSDGSMSGREDPEDRLARMELDIEVGKELKEQHQQNSGPKNRRALKRLQRKDKKTRRQRVTAMWTEEMQQFGEGVEKLAEKEHRAAGLGNESGDDDDEKRSSDSDDDSGDGGAPGMHDKEDPADAVDAVVTSRGIDDDEGKGDESSEEKAKAEEPDAKRRKKGDKPLEDAWRAKERSDRWFSQDIFSGVNAAADGAVKGDDSDSDSDSDSHGEHDAIEIDKNADVEGELSDGELPQMPLTDKQRRQKQRKKKQKRLERSGVQGDKDKGEMEIVPAIEPTPLGEDLPGAEKPEGPEKPTDPQELAETMAMGSLMIQKKSRMDLIDSAFNRWSFDGNEGLPSWFVSEEDQFNKPELPISKELAQAFRDKLREINARPIRKVAEARARKGKRLNNRIEKLRKTAAMLMETPDMSEKAKGKQMQKMVNKAKGQDQRPVSYVAIKKGGGGRKVDKSRAPRGAKIKVVDRRTKSDMRGKKRAAKRIGGKKGRQLLGGSKSAVKGKKKSSAR